MDKCEVVCGFLSFYHVGIRGHSTISDQLFARFRVRATTKCAQVLELKFECVKSNIQGAPLKSEAM